MTTRVAALAFAAIPLTAAPALADQPARTSITSTSGLALSFGDASFYISAGNNSWRGRDGRYYARSSYGQSPWEMRQLRRTAMQSCAAAIQRQGYRVGFRDVDIDDDIRARQTGRNSFSVRFNDVEFEGRRRELERDITCNFSYGRVVSISGIPQQGSRGYGYRWDNQYRHGHSYGHGGHSYGRSNGQSNHGWSQGRNDNDQGRGNQRDDDERGRDRGRENDDRGGRGGYRDRSGS